MFEKRSIYSRPRRKRSFKISSLIIASAVIGFLMIGIFYGWYRYSLTPVNAFSIERKDVTIGTGASVRSIASGLKENGLIRSELAFLLFVKWNNLDTKLQAGRFILRPSLSVPQLSESLQSGKAQEIALVIPEGFTVKDIDDLLAKNNLEASGETVRCANECDFSSFEFLPEKENQARRGGRLEGYLYPDTYFVEIENFKAKFFLERMLSTFQKKVLVPLKQDLQKSEYSLHQIITMASLIEEESRHDEERKTVSGILWKRLENDVILGVDATVRYILEKPREILTKEDLKTDSAYNTRRQTGLPPGPIASPGLGSISAALNPAATGYWYYLHDKEGNIHYSETNEEHNLKKEQYLR